MQGRVLQGFRQLLLLITSLVLAACTAVPVRLDAGNTLDRYTLEGRFGLRDNGNAQQGRIRWQHGPEGNRILLQDPLGGGVAELVEGPAGARMQRADGGVDSAADAPTLMRQLTGVALPVGSVARWLTGRALPADGVERDSAGRPRRLIADGWRVDYEYAGDAADELPWRVFAANGKGIELRLVIDQWQLAGQS